MVFWTKGDAEVETGQTDGKNPKQDQNPEAAKHDSPVLSITSHSLGSGRLLATLTDVKNWLTGKDSDAGKDWKQEKEMTEEGMAGWHHRLDGHEFE